MTDTKKTQLHTSPKGEILKMFIDRKVAPYGMTKEEATAADKMRYEIQLRFDAATPEGAEFKKMLLGINEDIIGKKHVNSPTQFTVRLHSKYQPKVVGPTGDELAGGDIPAFPQGSTGTASVLFKTIESKKGSGLALAGVALSSLSLSEAAGSGSYTLEALRESIKNA